MALGYKSLRSGFKPYTYLILAIEAFINGSDFDKSFGHVRHPDITPKERVRLEFLLTQSVRYYNLHNHIIQKYLTKKPQKKFQSYIQAVLMAGCTEVLCSASEDNIILSKYTDIVKYHPKAKHLSGLIRAILGQIAKDKNSLKSLYQDFALIFDKAFYASVKADYPDDADHIFKYLLQKPSIGLSVLQKDFKYPETISPNHDKHFNLDETVSLLDYQPFTSGQVTVQSFASALPVLGLGDIKGKVFYDLCAAPGGKSLQAAAAGANVTSVDISSKRMQKLEENLLRTGLDAQLKTVSVLDFMPENPADIILLDAPCSATGTLRKNPDLVSRASLKDIAGLCDLQKKLLNHAAGLVKKDGILVYATCSLSKQEGEEQIKAFLEKHKNFKAFLPEMYKSYDFIYKDNMIRILPSHRAQTGGMDGFFICYMECSYTKS
ncbi:MAG: RsmB/NOP family class I SAM-dependent RNA methyltransferase [Pseudomonadota bacterium]